MEAIYEYAEHNVKQVRDELLELETKYTALKDRHEEIGKKTRDLSTAYSLGFNPSLMQKLEQGIKKTKECISKAEERLSEAAVRLELNQLRTEREAIRLEREALVEERRELEQLRETIMVEVISETLMVDLEKNKLLESDEIILLKPYQYKLK